MAAVLLAFGVIPFVLDAAWRRQIAQGKWPGSPPGAAGGRPADPAAWWGLYQTRTIIQSAVLEGAAAFFQVIAYLLEGLPLSLGFTLGLILTLTLLVPKRETVERWVAVQRDRIEQGR